MQRLVNEVKETANLAVLEGTEAVYVHQVECSNVVRMFTRLGAHVPIHCSGVGKVLVANFADDDIRKLLGNGPLPRFTSATITDIDALLKELKRVRTKDYAVDNEEREEGVRCVTASIRDRSGMTVAGLSVSGPTTRMLMKRIRKLADAVIGAADEISAALGFSKSPRNGES
jgi:IclR family acetate operon transcriptional repressor